MSAEVVLIADSQSENEGSQESTRIAENDNDDGSQSQSIVQNPVEVSHEGNNDVQVMEVDDSANAQGTLDHDAESEVKTEHPSTGATAMSSERDRQQFLASTAVQTSPGLYLKQHLANNSPDDFRKMSKRTKAAQEAETDDSQCCTICFEPWSNSGEHRLASLNCGHLFGRSCIERWLKTKGSDHKCPQCNAAAKKKDIRNIYAKAIQAIDTTERDDALSRLEQEKAARSKAEEAEARALLQYQLAKAESERFKEELKRQQELIEKLQQQNLSQGSSSQTMSQPSTSGLFPAISKPNGKYLLQTSFSISQGGARVMSFDNHHGVLVVSRPSPNQLFPGFGVMKVSSLDCKHTQYLSIHKNPIRDCAFNKRGDGLLLTASMDKTIKVASILSNTVVQTYSTPVPAWSCTWNSLDTNYMYAGLQNGVTLVFDIRNTSTHVKDLQNPTGGACPVISVAHVAPSGNSLLRPGGVLTCTLEGGCFWENGATDNYIPHKLTFPEGSCTCLSFEPSTRHCLVSLRPSRSFSKSRHVVCLLQGKGISHLTTSAQTTDATPSEGSACTCQTVQQCVGGTLQKLLTRSVLFTNPNEDGKLIVASGDETTKTTMLWDGSNGSEFQRLPSPDGTPVLDVLPFIGNSQHFLSSITGQKLAIYKWQ